MTEHPHRTPDRLSKTIDEWSKNDRDLWLEALQPGDVLEDGGELSLRSPFTIFKIRNGYGRWLVWLARCGLLDEAESPADRITPDRVRDYVAALGQVNATATIICRLEELRQAAKIMDPARNWCWIASFQASVRRRHQPARPKRHRLVGIEVLFDLGVDLMARSDNECTDRKRLITFRDGLLIGLLAARPLRLRNLVGLALDRHLMRRGVDWWIGIDASETKTHEPIEMPWPEALATHLERYLAEIRPGLAARRGPRTRPADGALWLATDGSPMTRKGIYLRVIARTRAAFGRPINPHLFRDCAAASIAIDDPIHVGIASRLLGHGSRSTTERHYNQARAVEASRQLQAVLIALRHGKARG